MSTQPNTTDLDRLEALAKAAANGEQSVTDHRLARLEFEQSVRHIEPQTLLELIALARRSQPVAATQQAAREQQEPVGWVYGNSYWEAGNPRLTDHIKQCGEPRYAAPVAQQSEAERKLVIANRCIVKLQCEVDEARAATKAAAPADAEDLKLKLRTLFYAATAVIERWDSPLWKGESTAALIARLREATNTASSNCRASSVPAIPGTGREKEWISVTDKLPDPNGTYLVASNWGVRAAYLHDPAWAQGCWQDALSKTDEGEMDFDYKQKGRFKVTHWMPLPDAPSHPSEAKAGEDA